MKKLGFGLMRLPKLDKDDESSVEYEQVDKMAETFRKMDLTTLTQHTSTIKEEVK